MCKRQIWRTLARFKISRFSFLRESKFQKNLDTTHFISCEDCAVQCDYAITGCPICRCAVICITKMLDWLNTIYSLLFHFSHFSLVTHFFVFGPSRDHVRITLYTFHFGQSNFLIWRLFFEHRWRNVNLTGGYWKYQPSQPSQQSQPSHPSQPCFHWWYFQYMWKNAKFNNCCYC